MVREREKEREKQQWGMIININSTRVMIVKEKRGRQKGEIGRVGG